MLRTTSRVALHASLKEAAAAVLRLQNSLAGVVASMARQLLIFGLLCVCECVCLQQSCQGAETVQYSALPWGRSVAGRMLQ